MFGEVVVAVAGSSGKSPMFGLDERVALAREALDGVPNVRVIGFEGLLIDLLEREGASFLLRGLRAVSDFEYEFQLAGMNRRMRPDVETVFLDAFRAVHVPLRDHRSRRSRVSAVTSASSFSPAWCARSRPSVRQRSCVLRTAESVATACRGRTRMGRILREARCRGTADHRRMHQL
jgi:hypothetical protein